MLNQLMAQLTTKRIIIILGFIALTIYIIWYVIKALEGFSQAYVLILDLVFAEINFSLDLHVSFS